MIRSLISKFAVVCLLLTATGVLAGETKTGPGYELTVSNDRVSLQANNSPLIQVLNDIASEVGFEIDADIGDEIRITQEIRDGALDDVIRKVCRSVGYLVVRDRETQRYSRLILTPKKLKVTQTAARQADPPGWKPAAPPPEPPPEAQPPQQVRPKQDARGAQPETKGEGVTQDQPVKKDD